MGWDGSGGAKTRQEEERRGAEKGVVMVEVERSSPSVTSQARAQERVGSRVGRSRAALSILSHGGRPHIFPGRRRHDDWGTVRDLIAN